MNRYIDFTNGKLIENIVENNKNEILEQIKQAEIDDGLFFTVPELKILEGLKDNLSIKDKAKLKQCHMFLYLKYPTELSYLEYKKLHSKYNLYHLFVQGFSKTFACDLADNKSTDIDPRIMLIYLKKLDELTKSLPSYSDNNFLIDIKTICVLVNRIVEKVFYDVNTATLQELKSSKSRYNVPNEIIGLIDERAVCRGYAGIFRDACRILGFDVVNTIGFNESLGGHEWNQVRIGKKWYNCDITWDTYSILNKLIPIYLLSSDTDFYKDGYKTPDGKAAISHSAYLNIHDANTANETIPRELIAQFLYSEEKKKKDWLLSLLLKNTNKNINEGGISK